MNNMMKTFDATYAWTDHAGKLCTRTQQFEAHALIDALLRANALAGRKEVVVAVGETGYLLSTMSERAVITAFGKINGRHDFDAAEELWETRNPAAKTRWRKAMGAALDAMKDT